MHFLIDAVDVGERLSCGIDGHHVDCIAPTARPEDAAQALAVKWPPGMRGYRACADGPRVRFIRVSLTEMIEIHSENLLT